MCRRGGKRIHNQDVRVGRDDLLHDGWREGASPHHREVAFFIQDTGQGFTQKAILGQQKYCYFLNRCSHENYSCSGEVELPSSRSWLCVTSAAPLAATVASLHVGIKKAIISHGPECILYPTVRI